MSRSENSTRPLQNRVAPDGTLHAVAETGRMMGNRGGRIHDDAQQICRRWASKAWISCVLEFKGRRRSVMGDSYTELFFLDEMTALTAGHRPCFECRYKDAMAFATLWNRIRGLPGRAYVADMDAVLHVERQILFSSVPLCEVPPTTMIEYCSKPYLKTESGLYLWKFSGYETASLDPHTQVRPLTPPSIQAIIQAGFRPGLALP